jgi:2'-5' RNA ligase
MIDASDRPLTSAVLICAPPEPAAFVRAYRQTLGAEGMHHVPPHITVMYPFVSPGTVGAGMDSAVVTETTAQLRSVCRSIAPFSITVDSYGVFAASGVLYLALREPQPVIVAQEKLLAAFPKYVPYGGEFDTFIPHMTIGVFGPDSAVLGQAHPAFDPFIWQVEKLYFMVGDLKSTTMWQTAAVIPLEG